MNQKIPQKSTKKEKTDLKRFKVSNNNQNNHQIPHPSPLKKKKKNTLPSSPHLFQRQASLASVKSLRCCSAATVSASSRRLVDGSRSFIRRPLGGWFGRLALAVGWFLAVFLVLFLCLFVFFKEKKRGLVSEVFNVPRKTHVYQVHESLLKS